MSRAVAVITRTGRSSRPASSQPTATDSSTSTARLATTSAIGPKDSANGCLTTGDPEAPTCVVELTAKNTSPMISRPEIRNAPAYSSANRSRTLMDIRPGNRPRGRCG